MREKEERERINCGFHMEEREKRDEREKERDGAIDFRCMKSEL